VALRAMNQGGDGRSLASLINRSAELKRVLVDFALSPRMDRHLERFMGEGASPHEVDGIFEIRGGDRDSLIVLNLVVADRLLQPALAVL
jgi:hypothetical protein